MTLPPPAAPAAPPPSQDEVEAQLLALVARVMRIESVAWGGPDDTVRARFVGRILGDTAAAFDRLWAALAPWDLTPLFRPGPHGRHVVLLVQGRIRPQPSRAWINGVLFVVTAISVFWTGFWGHAAGDLGAALRDAALFTAALLGILLAHEFGHYFMARRHGMAVSLPYFLPLPAPFSPFGTLGAFIRLKEPPRNRRVLLDVGLAGPIAGLALAVPLLFLGLYASELGPLPAPRSGQALMLEGNSLFYLAAKYLVFGRVLPAPPGDMDWLTALRFFFTGRPVPWGGVDVILHPVAFAAWTGLLVTALNLLPVGQLDGGHVLFALLGPKARRFYPLLVALTAVLGVFWSGWWLWTVLILWLGRTYAEPLDMITPLDPARRRWAWFGLLVWVLTFTPIPLQLFVGR
ncbi:MAG: site-2 protease family protein [Chloroflexi bacterium]|nr:site-2 protease family protein [Chloroflexota bacterium]